MNQFQVCIVGAGNVGYQLAWHLHYAGHRITEVFSRHLPAAKRVGVLLDIPYTDRLDALSNKADIYLISVKDDAITEVVSKLHLPGKVVAHTSGTVAMELLSSVSEHYGIFYPLQSLSQHISADFSTIPFCISGSDDFCVHQLRTLASSITNHIVQVNDEQRLAIHVAAVFANNFSNHLFAVADAILHENGLSFEILKPLIKETVRKIQNHHPLSVQTGPALRNDLSTISRHLQFLENHENRMRIYQALTNSICQMHKTSKPSHEHP